MKRKNLFITLICILCACIAGFLVCSCSNAGLNNGESSGESTFTGLTVKSEITCNAGELVTLEIPIVRDQNGDLLDVFTSVVDSTGAFVEINGGSFFAIDGGGYVITYSVYTADKEVHSQKTKVNVVGNYYITLDMDRVVWVGETVKFNFSNKLSNPSFTYSVKFNDTNVAVDANNSFTCENSGFYDCTITAVDDYHPADDPMVYTFKVYAYSESDYEHFGLIESFDEKWETIRDISGFGRQGWSLTDSETTGVKDHNGVDSYFATTEMAIGMNYNNFYLNPLYDSKYYASLVEEGYKNVEVWIYIDGPSSYYVENFMTDTTSYEYIRSLGYITPYKWTKISIPLVGGEKTWSKSFTDCVDNYKSQIVNFLKFSNGDQKVTSKIYLSDIYAVKTIDSIEAKASYTVPEVGVSYNFDDMFNVSALDYAVTYNVTSDHGVAKTIKQGETYQFTSNGNYTVTAMPSRPDYVSTFTSSISFDVNDAVVMQNNYKSFERTSDEFDVYMQSVKVGANPVTGLDVKITYQGEDLDIFPEIKDPKGNTVPYDGMSDYFTVSKDGNYVLYYTADYEINGVPCKSYKEFSLDIWSQETKYVMGLTEDMAVCRIDSDKTASVGESVDVVAGGISGKKYMITPNTVGAIVAIKPLFSKNYYKALKNEMLAADPDASLEAIIEAYVEGKIGAMRTIKTSTATVDRVLHNINDFAVGYYEGTGWLDYKRAYFYGSDSGSNKWCNTTISLDSFIDVYDMLASNYEDVSSKTNVNTGYPYRFNAYDYYASFWTVTSGTHVYFTDLELSVGKVNYNVESYVETGTNTNLYTWSTETLIAKTGSTVSANPLIPEGYYFDAENEEGVTSAVVKQDGSTTLKLYYRRLPLYKVEYYTRAQNADGTFKTAVLQSNRTQYVYAAAGTKATADISVTFPYCRFNAGISLYEATVPNSDELVLKLYYDSYAKDLGLIDTSTGNNTFDLSNYLSGSGSAYSYTLWKLFPNGTEVPMNNVATYISDAGIVNYEMLEGMYVVKAAPKSSGDSEIVNFEAYNENEYVWNTVSSDNLDSVVYSYLPQLLDATNEVSVKKIGTKNYFEFNVRNGYYRSFSMIPAHSVEYYDRLRGQGIELSFRFKRVGESGWAQFFSFSTENQNGTYGTKSGEWYTVSISIEDIVDKYWNAIFDPSCLMTSWNERGLCGMMTIVTSETNTVTVGDFAVKKTVEFDLSKVDTATLSEYDLTKLMSPITLANVNKIGSEGYTIETIITSVSGVSISVPDPTNCDLSSLTKAYYEVNVYAVKNSTRDLLYSAGLEVFDSNEGVVFNSVDTNNLGYMTAHYFADNVSDITVDGDSYKIVYPVAPKSINTFRSFQILPIHSKTYYQKYYDEDLLLSFDINFQTAEGEYNGETVVPDTFITYQQFKDKQYHKQVGLNYLHTVYIRLNDILDNWSAYNTFANNDSRTGATLRTIGNGAGVLTVTISNIKLSQPYDGAETSVNYLKGKNVAVIGDSISTWVDGFYATSYYPIESTKKGEDFVRSDMWWQKAADNFGMNITRNNSVSGRTAAAKGSISYGGNTGVDLVYERCDKITPDYVFLFLGTNDRIQGVDLGTVDSSLFDTVAAYNPVYNDSGAITNRLTDYASAYARIIYDIQRTYQGAKVYCLNIPSLDGEEKTTQMNGIISAIAAHYGAEVVDLNTAFGSTYKASTLDGLHPNKAGQAVIANELIAKLNSDYQG